MVIFVLKKNRDNANVVETNSRLFVFSALTRVQTSTIPVSKTKVVNLTLILSKISTLLIQYLYENLQP